MKKTILCGALAVVAFGCSDKNDDPIPSSKNLYPSKIVKTEGDAVSATIYEYDAQNRLIKSIETDNYKDITTTTVTYTYTNNLLSEVRSVQTATNEETIYRSVLNYVNGQLTTVFEYSGSETTTSNRDSLFYNGGTLPNIVKQHNGFESNTLTYDLVGNKMAVMYSDKQNKTGETTLSYDTNHRHYTWCIPTPTDILGQFAYCPTRVEGTWTQDGIVTAKETTSFSYTFNADGYPTKVIVSEVGDDLTAKNEDYTSTETIEITYK